MAVQPLSSITAIIKNGAFSRAYDYRIAIKKPPVGFGKPWEIDLRCESISYPSQNIETTQDNIRIGPIREHAFSVNYGSVTATFLDDDKLGLKRYFEDWQRKIFDPDTFRMNYYEDYIGELEISHFRMHKEGAGVKPDYKVSLREVFPKTVTQLEVGTANGEFLRLTVEFQYHHWTKII